MFHAKPSLDRWVVQGDARMLPLANHSVQCIVTSPPYWGQRKYRGRTLIWKSEVRSQKSECEHLWRSRRWYTERSAGNTSQEAFSEPGGANRARLKKARWRRDAICRRCGAWRGQLGLEPTPELYVQHLVEIFREARRVLKPSGTLWLVISDSRPGNKGAGGRLERSHKQLTNTGSYHSHDVRTVPPSRRWKDADLKYSDMLGLPHDLVKALRADGWYWRDEIVWRKPNGFCESVRSRTTHNHEYIFLLTKSPSPRYYFDVEAIMEPCQSGPSDVRKMLESKPRIGGLNVQERDPLMRASSLTNIGRKRSVGGAILRLDREGVNSQMHQDRDPNHPQARKSRSGNKIRLLAGRERTNKHLGFNVPWEGLYRRKRSVWSVAVTKPRGLKHYATFPEKLIEPMILAGCPQGGLVLDPCGGSGTVAVVAHRFGRRSLVLDLSRAYCRMAMKRLGGAPKGCGA